MEGSIEGNEARVAMREALRFWVRLGFINFGGPTGQIAIMHDELVERRRWISEDRFLHALNYCMLLPGPEAHQLAIYVGWLLNGTPGALAAGVFFILPAFFLMLGLSWTYVAHGDVAWIAAILYGLRAAVVAIVAAAVIRIGARALKDAVLVAIAALAFVAIFLFGVGFPWIVGGAAIVGLVGGARWPEVFGADRVESAGTVPEAGRGMLRRAARVLLVGLLVWWGPLALVVLWRGGSSVFADQAVFFSKVALVTFGGAYAVLSYINQAAVLGFGWLSPGQMVVGLGLAESTPGPLILVTQFVGFIGAYRNPGGLSPLAAGVLGSAVVVWAVFVPSFIWIFLGAPFLERLRGNVRLRTALGAVTAAVVGVIVNLAVWFAAHVLFTDVSERHVLGAVVPVPRLASVDGFAVVLAVVLFVGMWRFRWRIVPVVLASAAAGLAWRLVT